MTFVTSEMLLKTEIPGTEIGHIGTARKLFSEACKASRLPPNTLGSCQATSEGADMCLVATDVTIYCK